jgi:hypothetical protein
MAEQALSENAMDIFAVTPCDKARVPELVNQIVLEIKKPFDEVRHLRLLYAAYSLI